MAVKKVWIGSTGPFLFDDSVLYIDEEGVIAPDNQQAIATNGQIVVQSPPTSDVHVARKYELDRIGATLGLGSMAYQNSNAVAITGGTIYGLTGLDVPAPVYGGGFYRLNAAGNGIYGFFSAVNAAGGSDRYGFHSAGDAPNRFNGPVGIQAAPVVGYSLITELTIRSNGNIDCGGVLYVTGAINAYNNLYVASLVGIGVVPLAGYSLRVGGQVLLDGNLDCQGAIFANGVLNAYNDVYVATRLGIGQAVQVNKSLAVSGYTIFNGGVGIGTDNTLTSLQLTGTAGKNGGGPWFDTTSSATLKRNIRPIEGALEYLLALSGRWWEWREDRRDLEELMPGRRAGFVIEEVQESRPDWVVAGDDNTPILAEQGFSAYAVEALRELHSQVQGLMQQVKDLTARVTELEASAA